MLRSILTAALLTIPALASATIDSSLYPVYDDAGQYTASVSPRSQQWRLAPLVGDVVDVQSAACPHTAVPPKGLWVLGFDANGQPELVAPSATLLPAGHSGRVALRACDDPELQSSRIAAYGVPRQVLQWLVSDSGAVLVND